MSTRRSSGSGLESRVPIRSRHASGGGCRRAIRIAGKTDMDTGTSPEFTIFKGAGSF